MLPPLFLNPNSLDLSWRIQPPSSRMLENADKKSDQFVYYEGKLYRLIGMEEAANPLFSRFVYMPAKTPFMPEIYTSFFTDRFRQQKPLAKMPSPLVHQPFKAGPGQHGVDPLKCLKEEADNNEPGALYLLATCLEQPEKDNYLWKIGQARQHYPYYYYELGRQAENNQLFDPTGEVAAEHYSEAAKRNHAYASYRLGLQWLKKENDEAAYRFFKKAAEEGVCKAQYKLGCLYEEGKGVEKSPIDAMIWYGKAADQGHRDAMYLSYRLFSFNMESIKESLEDAIYQHKKYKADQYLELAAKAGHAEAQFAYGCKRKEYQIPNKSPIWLEKAADQGHGLARCLLTLLCLQEQQRINNAKPMPEKVEGWIPEILKEAKKVHPNHQKSVELYKKTLEAIENWKKIRHGIVGSAGQAAGSVNAVEDSHPGNEELAGKTAPKKNTSRDANQRPGRPPAEFESKENSDPSSAVVSVPFKQMW